MEDSFELGDRIFYCGVAYRDLFNTIGTIVDISPIYNMVGRRCYVVDFDHCRAVISPLNMKHVLSTRLIEEVRRGGSN